MEREMYIVLDSDGNKKSYFVENENDKIELFNNAKANNEQVLDMLGNPVNFNNKSNNNNTEDFKPFELKKPQLQKEIESFSPPQSRGEFERQEEAKKLKEQRERANDPNYVWSPSDNKYISKDETDEAYISNLQNVIHHDIEDVPGPDLAPGNMGRREVDRLVQWFNNDSNYSNSGVKLNVSSRDSKFEEVELLFWNQEPGQGHTFDIRDPKLFDNIKAQIDQEVHTDKKTKNLDYLSKLIPPQILNYTDDGYGNDEVNKATFHKNLNTIVNFIKNKKQDTSYLGSYSDPYSKDLNSNISLEEIEEFFNVFKR